MIDLALYGAPVLASTLALLGEHGTRLESEGARPLLVRLLKTAMAPLEREGDWAAMAVLLRALDHAGALAAQDALLPQHKERNRLDHALLPDATLAALAGLMDAAGCSGSALALLDEAEHHRHEPRFMAMSWQARCHILRNSPAIDHLWPTMGAGTLEPRTRARAHAQARRMEEALLDLTTALDEAVTPPARRGLGAELAVLAAWLHGHGQGALLETYRPLARHLADQPALAREALDLLLRAPAMQAWEPMRESWLEAARRYFQRFTPASRLRRPGDLANLCRPAA
jgi:hypothetical protein